MPSRVSLPSAVRLTWVDGSAQSSTTFAVTDPDAGSGPSWLNFSGLNIASTPWVQVSLVYGNEWVFVDEVAFTGVVAVPEPAAWMTMAGGLALLAARRRKPAA